MSRLLPLPVRPYFSRLIIYTLAAAVVTIFPLLLWRWDPVFIRNTYGEAYEPFELFGIVAAAAVLGHTIWRVRQEPSLTWERLLPILVPAGVLLHYISLFSEYSIPSWDYNCYRLAANELLAGNDLYSGCYLYPPLLAEIIAAVQQAVLRFTLISHGERERSWEIVFYLFQCAQFFALALAYPLLYRFTRRLGVQKVTAVFLVAAVLLFNNPLLRTIRHTQVNLFVLDLFLLALLLADRAAWLSGFTAAVGIHLKLYPAVLFLPWLLTKRWRPVIFALIGLAFLVLLSADWGADWQVWRQFWTASGEFPPGNQFRDNSLHSLVFNGIGFFAAPAGMASSTFRTIVSIVVMMLSLLLTGWVSWRIYQRQRLLSTNPDMSYIGQAIDALALGLMLAPRVWEHHYVLALPVVLWGMAVSGRKRPLLVGIAAVLILALPTFDIYPFSYHRLAGLILMLYLTPPSASDPPENAIHPAT
jgi:hypothetical protein